MEVADVGAVCWEATFCQPIHYVAYRKIRLQPPLKTLEILLAVGPAAPALTVSCVTPLLARPRPEHAALALPRHRGWAAGSRRQRCVVLLHNSESVSTQPASQIELFGARPRVQRTRGPWPRTW